MPWARIDDGFHAHPKTLAAGLAAVGLHTLALSYCAHYLTDGVVPAKFVGSRKAIAAKLVTVGLWHEHPDGYVIHDYLKYNPSRADVEAERQRTKTWRRRSERVENDHAIRPSPLPSPLPKELNQDGGGELQVVRDPVPPTRVVSTVSRLVDMFRALPGNSPRENDGGVVVGQVGRYGAALVERVLRDAGDKIGAADNPAQYFVGACQGTFEREKPPVKERPAVLGLPAVDPEQAAANRARVAAMASNIGRVS